VTASGDLEVSFYFFRRDVGGREAVLGFFSGPGRIEGFLPRGLSLVCDFYLNVFIY
jgi:hypothetical protein